MSAKPKKLLLLDANALLHRAWHALPPLKAPDGTLVNAAYGMGSVALKMMKEEAPDLFVACWDTAAPTFRHEAFEAYKAQREEKEQELYDQIPVAKELLEAIGIRSVALDGYEADDLIGTLAKRGEKEGYDVRIVTGDRDALQLVGGRIAVVAFKKGVSETKLYDTDAIKEEYGLSPEQIIDLKAIAGDTSDNIPGIRGIGQKGATDLISAFGSLEGALKAAHDPKSEMKDGVRKKLIEGEADGRQALELVRIDTNVPLKETFKDLACTPDRDRFVELAGMYGFRSLIARFDSIRAQGAGRGAQGKGEVTSYPSASSGQATSRVRGRGGVKVAARVEVVKTEDEGVEALSKISGTRIVAHVIHEAQDSLFSSADALFVIADEESCAAIPLSLLRSLGERSALVSAIRNALTTREVVCHDAKLLVRDLELSEITLGPVAHDTLLAAYLMAAGERTYDLSALALQEVGEELPKPDTDPGERAAKTARIIRGIAERQRAAMTPEGMVAFMERFELPLTPVLRAMERTGIRIDLPYLSELSERMNKMKAEIEFEMESTVGHPFNAGSPIQLATILFDELKLPTKGIKRGKTGFSTAASELDKLEGAHPIIALIAKHREVAKLLSTYVETLPALADVDARVHTTFNQTMTSTGRLSSSDPNLQNIPIRSELGREIRRAFIARPGMKLVSCDYSQIELRVIAALSRDKNMLGAFERGEDIHTATAAAIWGIDPAKVTKHQRRAAKAINFGIIYGQGPQGLSRSAEIPFEEARTFIDAYFRTYQGIKEFLETTKVLARSRGYVETLFGRRRPIPDILSGVQQLRAAAERMAINMPVQGTSADIMKLAMIAIAGGLPEVSPESRMLLQVHDELVFEVPEADVSHVAAYAKDVMERIESIGCPILVEPKRGTNWDEMIVI